MKNVIVLIHEIYGLTDNLKKLQSLLRTQGFSVALPSLYQDAYVGSDEKYCYQKFFSEVGIETATARVKQIVAEHIGQRITLIGFSIGATVAWLQAGNRDISAIIGFYGSRIRNYLDIEPIIDCHLFFCNEPGFEVKTVLDQLNTKDNVKAQLIPGQHGFYSTAGFDSAIIKNANHLILEACRTLTMQQVVHPSKLHRQEWRRT